MPFSLLTSRSYCSRSFLLLGNCLGLLVVVVLGVLLFRFIRDGAVARVVVGFVLLWCASAALAVSPLAYARLYCWARLWLTRHSS